MGKCCGGKNAGKPVSVPRYIAGLGVFVTYHAAVHALLRVAAKPMPELSHVRDFHGQVFKDELKEILTREGIVVDGLLRSAEWNEECEVGIETWEVDVSSGAASQAAVAADSGARAA